MKPVPLEPGVAEATLKLIPFSAQYLRLDDPLPFGLRDASGRLLLAAGHTVPGEAHLAELREQPLYAEEHEAAAWTRRLGAAVDAALRQGGSLKAVVAARPEAAGARESGSAPTLSFSEQWHELISQLEGALRDVQPASEWRSRLLGVHGRARQLFQRRPDASLYCLTYESMHSTQRYSCRHALLVMGVCEQAAAVLGWSPAWTDSLGRAALSMNVGMLKLQDQLAATQLPPTPAMREEIAGHAQASVALLENGGLGDPLCLQAIALHHETLPHEAPLADRPPHHQLAELLRRVDALTAKFSRRASREPMSPVQAVREACLAAGGRPDELAGALLKALGLYPPGCFVELVGGELAIVLARGAIANQPRVATLVAASGLPLMEPVLRDTADRRYAIKGVVAAGAVKVRPSHDKLLALR
jgi:HD-GYP domain-containing protein (c-di-GMP phosphodiesterase class II)